MAQIVIIEARREGYSTDQIRRTLTVEELIEILEQYDGNTLIMLSHDNGYTYGGITSNDIDFRYVEEEKDQEED